MCKLLIASYFSLNILSEKSCKIKQLAFVTALIGVYVCKTTLLFLLVLFVCLFVCFLFFFLLFLKTEVVYDHLLRASLRVLPTQANISHIGSAEKRLEYLVNECG